MIRQLATGTCRYNGSSTYCCSIRKHSCYNRDEKFYGVNYLRVVDPDTVVGETWGAIKEGKHMTDNNISTFLIGCYDGRWTNEKASTVY